MPITNGTDYDHIDVKETGSDPVRHMLKDTDARTRIGSLEDDVEDLKSALSSLGDVKTFHPTAAYSTKFDYNFVSGTAYLFENNGSVRCTLSSNDGTSKVEDIGTIEPGGTLTFVATANASKLNCYLASADSTGAISVCSGEIAKSEIRTKDTFDELHKFPVFVDDDCAFFTDFRQGVFNAPARTDRVSTDRIMLNPGDTINVSGLSGIQHKIFVFLNKTTMIYVAETSAFWAESEYTNTYFVPTYCVIVARINDATDIAPDDLIGIQINITSHTTLSETKKTSVDNLKELELASKVYRREFFDLDNVAAYEFTFVAGKRYRFYNAYSASATLSTRATTTSAMLENIGTIAPGEKLDFTPTLDAGALYVYANTGRHYIIAYFGDGLVASSLNQMAEAISGLESTVNTLESDVSGLSLDINRVDESVDALETQLGNLDDKAVKINSLNLFNPNLPLASGKCYNSSGEMEASFYWSIAPLIDVRDHHGHTIMTNKWAETNNRYMCFIDDAGVKTPALITNEPITIPNDAVYASIPMNRASGNDYDFEDAYIWFDERQGFYVPYSEVGAYFPLRTYYYIPDDVKGCLDTDSPFRLDSATKLQDVYDFYDRLKASFNTVMTREEIGQSAVPTGEWATIDPNTYPLYAYHIYPTDAPRDTDNVFLVNSCIHGDSYPNGATVANDAFEHVAALGYAIKEILLNPGNNDITKFIREKCHLIVIPVVNPWGCQNGHRHNGRGVDLNRNFPYGFVPNQTSYDGTSGPEALSESESKAVYDFISDVNESHPLKFYIDFQARGGAYGIGSNDNRYLPIWSTEVTGVSFRESKDVMKRVGDTLIRRFGGIYQPQVAENNGKLENWVALQLKRPSLTIETFGAPTEDVYHRGHELHLKNSVLFFAESIDVFARHYIMGY